MRQDGTRPWMEELRAMTGEDRVGSYTPRRGQQKQKKMWGSPSQRKPQNLGRTSRLEGGGTQKKKTPKRVWGVKSKPQTEGGGTRKRKGTRPPLMKPRPDRPGKYAQDKIALCQSGGRPERENHKGGFDGRSKVGEGGDEVRPKGNHKVKTMTGIQPFSPW